MQNPCGTSRVTDQCSDDILLAWLGGMRLWGVASLLEFSPTQVCISWLVPLLHVATKLIEAGHDQHHQSREYAGSDCPARKGGK